jgi:hypothetical protein
MADTVAEVDPEGGRAEQDREDEQPELEAGELKEEDRATLSLPGRRISRRRNAQHNSARLTRSGRTPARAVRLNPRMG